MKVGVLFPSRFEDPGEFLADARAMEAAGVDSVWIEDDGAGLDPLLTLAAIATVAHEVRLALIRSSSAGSSGEDQRRIETLQRLSRQRAIVGVIDGTQVTSAGERWQRVEAPADGAAWAKILAQAEGHVDGVIVPLSPRLLDMLRHPDETIDRPDLQLAQG